MPISPLDAANALPTRRPPGGQPAAEPARAAAPAAPTLGRDQFSRSVLRYDAQGQRTNYTQLSQGHTNGCGTTSLAMMLNYNTRGDAFSRELVDAEIRHLDMYTAPAEIARYAEAHGMEASVHNGASLADLHAQIDQGRPVQVLLDVSEQHDGTKPHYEVVTGYGPGYVELSNPNDGPERPPQVMSEEAFMAKWSKLDLHGVQSGLSRVAITMKPAQSAGTLLADERGGVFDSGLPALRAAQGVSQVTNGVATLDPTQATEGAIRAVGGIPSAAVTAAGETTADAGIRAIQDGRERLGDGIGNTALGVLEVGGGALITTAGKTLTVAGELGSATTEVAARTVGAVGRGVSAAWHWVWGG